MRRAQGTKKDKKKRIKKRTLGEKGGLLSGSAQIFDRHRKTHG